MEKNLKILIVGLAAMVIGTALISQAAPELSARKIIVFKSGVGESTKEAAINGANGEEIKDLRLINAKAARLTLKAEKNLARHPDVLRIDDDAEVFAMAKFQLVQPAEVLPWGVDRVDAEKVWGQTTGDTIKVAVVDTGIEINHPDLKDNIKGGMSAVQYTSSFNDDNGHGTHVAGIIGAIDNAIGVIGVGPQIDLYAVKVLDRRGSGYLSDVIEGLDWAIQNKMQVVNMSLGTSADILSFREAIQKVSAAGIVQAAAAGNSGGAVIYPAAYPETIAVSATDNTNTIASWSSRGPEVDLSAPGVSIYSTYKGQTYKTLSGTSMAAPHVAGTAALLLTTPAKCDFDLNGICSPAEVQQRLEATAIDLGNAGKDNLYGSGLINAERAINQ